MVASWPEVALAALNVLQVIALALITARQAQVKRDLRGQNGAQARAIEELRRELELARTPDPSTPSR